MHPVPAPRRLPTPHSREHVDATDIEARLSPPPAQSYYPDSFATHVPSSTPLMLLFLPVPKLMGHQPTPGRLRQVYPDRRVTYRGPQANHTWFHPSRSRWIYPPKVSLEQLVARRCNWTIQIPGANWSSEINGSTHDSRPVPELTYPIYRHYGGVDWLSSSIGAEQDSSCYGLPRYPVWWYKELWVICTPSPSTGRSP